MLDSNTAVRQDLQAEPGEAESAPSPTAKAEHLFLAQAFRAFAVDCAETGWVDGRILLHALLPLIRAVRGAKAENLAGSSADISLPLAREVRDALWTAGRTGRASVLRGAIFSAQLRLRLT